MLFPFCFLGLLLDTHGFILTPFLDEKSLRTHDPTHSLLLDTLCLMLEPFMKGGALDQSPNTMFSHEHLLFHDGNFFLEERNFKPWANILWL